MEAFVDQVVCLLLAFRRALSPCGCTVLKCTLRSAVLRFFCTPSPDSGWARTSLPMSTDAQHLQGISGEILCGWTVESKYCGFTSLGRPSVIKLLGFLLFKDSLLSHMNFCLCWPWNVACPCCKLQAIYFLEPEMSCCMSPTMPPSLSLPLSLSLTSPSHILSLPLSPRIIWLVNTKLPMTPFVKTASS